MALHCPPPAVPWAEIAFAASLVGLASFMLAVAVAVFVALGGPRWVWRLINGGGEAHEP